jgi:type II secretory pathway component GspD/PulD (secretin)
MTTRFLLWILICVLVSLCVIAEEGLLTKAFTIKFKKVDEIATLVNEMLSERGAVTIQPRMKTLVVQDREDSLRRIEAVIIATDVPPPSVEISIKLVLARKNARPAPVSEEIKSIANVNEVLRYNNYSLLDSGLIESEEGESSTLLLANQYQLGFVTDVVQERSGMIRLKNFNLQKLKVDRSGGKSFASLISLTLNLRNAETLVLGASRFESSDQALLLILSGKVKK